MRFRGAHCWKKKVHTVESGVLDQEYSSLTSSAISQKNGNIWKKASPGKDAPEEGATVIEYAILAPIFFLMIFGIIELSLMFWVESTMELAIQGSSRFARTGDTVTGQSRAATMTSLVNQYTFGVLDPSKLILTITPYPSFAAVPDVLPTSGAQNFGAPGQVVVYTLSYDWPVFTGFVGDAMGVGQTITLKASEVTVNEPG